MATPLSFDDPRPDGGPRYPANPGGGGGAGRSKPFLFLTALGSLFGGIFAAVSTSDFISHLDRQVHSIHCSFIPGAGAQIGESGCRTVMLSPYSSIMRETLWGGLPIALLAVAVFAYLVMHTGRMILSSKPFTKNEGLYLIAATLLPVLMSLIFSYLAISKIGAVCKLCVGIYASSAVIFVGALLAHINAEAAPSSQLPMNVYARQFGEGVLYVAILAIFYVLFAPASPKSEQGCGTLVKKDDGSGIMIPMGRGKGQPAIAVVDPLCPACKGFDDRMRASDLYDKLSIEAVLFPLDSTCNWMVKESLHPGACAVSEAMLCAASQGGGAAEEILDYAFANQEELREMAKQDDGKLRARLEQQFPKVKGCLGSPKIKNQVNKSLRWAVSNALPVLTPQLFIGDKRVCDEDTDLGLEYTITRMLEGGASSSRRR
jgi:uncharacterized membrane protein